MKKEQKTILIVGGSILGAALLATIGYFAFRKKDEATDTEIVQYDELGNPILQQVADQVGNITSAAGTGKKYAVGYVSERPSQQELIVHFKSPRPVENTIPKGRKVQLTGMDKYNGTYTVKSIWNTNGKQGAIYLTSPKVTTANENNTTWDGKGVITVII